MEIGTTYTVQPEPPDPRCTVWVDAGALRFGVESRHVDPESLRASYRDDPDGWAEIEAASPDGGFTDEGVSIHVLDAASGHEYLRFDAFDDGPHYHYIWPTGDHNEVVPYDAVANGDALDWALACLRDRLPALMVRAQAGDLVDRLDPAVCAEALERVAALASAAVERTERP